jgi:hypothetical protein
MASSSADFLLICEGLFEPWHRASPAAVAAASAAAAKTPEVSKDGIVEEITTITTHAIGAKRRKVADVGTSSSSDRRTWNPERQLRVSKAISSAPWKRPTSLYLDAGHGSSRGSTDSRK